MNQGRIDDDARENALSGLLTGELAPVAYYLRSFDDLALDLLADLIEGYGPGSARLKITTGGREARKSFSRARQYVIAMAALRVIEQDSAHNPLVGDAGHGAAKRPQACRNAGNPVDEDLHRPLLDEQGLEKFELIIEAIRSGNDRPLIDALTSLAKEVRK